MKTEIFDGGSQQDIEKAAKILKSGGLVAIPTETVYGLAADALNSDAVAKIFKAKGRPMDNPLIVHISRFEEIYRLVKGVPHKAKELADRYWPGPMTIILPKSDIIPDEVSAGLPTVAVRMPSHPVARAIIEKTGRPLAAPSANSSGLPSPTTAKHVMDDMNGKIEAIVDGGPCDVGIESTVVTLATDPPRLLRPGGITHEQLEAVLGHVDIDPAVLSQLKEGERPASPGMKYKHYSPKAEVYIVNGSLPSFKYQIDCDLREGDAALCFDGEENELPVPCLSFGRKDNSLEQAHSLFDDLRKFDDMGIKRVFVRAPSAEGVGLGVYNRLLRAAAFKIIEPPVIYGLTGQSGAGKTTVGNELKKKSYLIVDGDILARRAVEIPDVLNALADEFGKEILDSEGNLIRSELAKRAFANEHKRRRLNRITHPVITALALETIRNKFTSEYKGVIIDAAAIFDCDLPKYCTKMIVVTADRDIRAERVMKRDGISRETAMLRINAQKNEQYYIEKADIIVRNNGSENLSDQLNEL